MLEQTIERLTLEVVKLRDAVERQTLVVVELGPANYAAVVPHTARQEPQRDAYLTEHAVAEFLGLSVALPRKWRLFRKGPPYRKLGRLVRYSRAEVNAWIERQKP